MQLEMFKNIKLIYIYNISYSFFAILNIVSNFFKIFP